jgi:pyruvate-formate lyase-activating enzyme
VRVLLVSCYELGHQPLGVAAPAAHLRARGHDVRALDLSIQSWDPELVDWADRIALATPMHTAMRMAQQAITLVREQRPDVPICTYGLYGPLLADIADRVLAGETDAVLAAWVEGDDDANVVFLDRHGSSSTAPARDLLPALDQYAHLALGDEHRTVAYVEASHGCAHRCRHCPVPVIYDGRIRIVDVEAVIADIAQQVDAGARHVTFGDPDFLNGVHHSLRVVRAMHERFPDLTFDCTVKVEHILRHDGVWAEMAASGCLFVVSAFEAVNDDTLQILDKGHTTADAARAASLLREHGIEIRPSFVPFTPWTSIDDIRALLEFVAANGLVECVDPVQYAIRLLVPPGSLLLDTPAFAAHAGPYDAERGTYTWQSPDPAVDDLHARISARVEVLLDADVPIPMVYDAVRVEAGLEPLGIEPSPVPPPRLTEPWFCCAEPTAQQQTVFGRSAGLSPH